MRRRIALALLCAACTCTAGALTDPCRFFEYRNSADECVACTEHTFGTPVHCEQYNASLLWAQASSAFARLQLHVRADECAQYNYSTGYPIKRLCNNTFMDGELAGTVVLAAQDGRAVAYTPRAPLPAASPCMRGYYRPNDGHCSQCPNNTTTRYTDATSAFDCEVCPLGSRWVPASRACERCPECYTTRPDPGMENANYTRAEHCLPCSVWADDYRRGGCDATVAGKCVLHVPYADVHAVHMTAAPDEYNVSWRGVFCSYEKWRMAQQSQSSTNVQIDECNASALLSESSCGQVDMYVYAAETQQVHALFRPQSREQVQDYAETYAATNAAYTGKPPHVLNYTYTTGTSLPGRFEDYWNSFYADRDSYDYGLKDVVPPPFELAGSYTYFMHDVSIDVAPYYDFARAYHEHWLLGKLAPSQQSCADQHEDPARPCEQHKLQEYGVLLCVNDTQKQFEHEEATDYTCKSGDDFCDVLTILCASGNHPTQPFCNIDRDSGKVWETLQFYMYNATDEYTDMDHSVRSWEEGVQELGGSTAPQVAACDQTLLELRIVVTNAPNGTLAKLHEISVQSLVNNDTLYVRALDRQLAQNAEPYVHNVSVPVAAGSAVQVRVLVSNSTEVAVTIVYENSDLPVTTTESTHLLQDVYDVCEESANAQLARVDTPLAFKRLHAFLDGYLCE